MGADRSSEISRCASPALQWTVAAVVMSLAALLMLSRLGHYALWDDEAITALTAEGVWQSGDTSAVLGHNVLAYRNGLLLRDLRDRSSPPLQFYLAAPFVGLSDRSALAARLPFALCGLAAIGLMLWWLHRERASAMAWIVLGIAIVGNVSLFLFARQARYYGPAMLLGVAVAYTHLQLSSRRGLIVHTILATLLLATNYMAYAAIAVMLVVDYALWGRRRFALRAGDWAILLLPQLVIGSIVVWIFNPLRIAEPRAEELSWLSWRAKLLWWHVRDLNACEFGVGALLLAAPVVWIFTRSQWLLRALVALVIGILVISIVSPQNPSNTRVSDVRYLSFLIPLCIAIGVLTILPLARLSRIATIAVAGVAFGSNLLNFSFVTDQPMRSTIYAYARELASPTPEPYTPVARWIGENVRDGQSVLVLPEYMMYPLMFHAPHAVYAWQLTDPAAPQFEHLPPIHFALRLPPEFIVTYGPAAAALDRIQMPSSEPIEYELAEHLPVFWRDAYRPELFWRTFTPIEGFDPRAHGIHILRRKPRDSGFRF